MNKKTKLLMPILGVSAIAGIAAPLMVLSSCGNKSQIQTITLSKVDLFEDEEENIQFITDPNTGFSKDTMAFSKFFKLNKNETIKATIARNAIRFDLPLILLHLVKNNMEESPTETELSVKSITLKKKDGKTVDFTSKYKIHDGNLAPSGTEYINLTEGDSAEIELTALVEIPKFNLIAMKVTEK